MERFPAVIIGGPPHSGKSVLTYSLTQALRQRGVRHYVVRAAPDGEGDWANEAAQELVRTLRVKGDFTPAFTDFICQSLTGRHLPLLVDAGGRPTSDQERIFDCCTHAILLTPDEPARAHWRALVQRHNLVIVADLTSRLRGEGQVLAREPVLQGIITGLERGGAATGPAFDALVDCLSPILYYDPDELYLIHENMCPVETVIDLDRLACTFGVPTEGEKTVWEARHLPHVWDYLPEAVPLGLYGRGPGWLYASVALLTAPALFVQFDPRCGWVQPTPLRIGTPEPESSLQVELRQFPAYVWVKGILPDTHLDHSQVKTLTVPPVPAGAGVILEGKLPHWLYTSLALTYRTAPWLAVYQPQLDSAVVVYSADRAHSLGDCIYPTSPAR